MSDLNNTAEDFTDPLGFSDDINDVSTLRPVLAEGQYVARITESKVVPKKDDNTKFNLQTTYALQSSISGDEMKDIDGKPINVGFTIMTYMPLQKSDKPNAPDFRVEVLKVMDAALKVKQGSRPTIRSWNDVGPMITDKELIIGIKNGKNKEDDTLIENRIRSYVAIREAT